MIRVPRPLFGLGLLLAVFCLGCGGGPNPQAMPEGPWEVTVISEGDTTKVPPGSEPVVEVSGSDVSESDVSGSGEPVAAEKPLPSRSRLDEPTQSAPAREYTFGYRIQIMASSSVAMAEEAASEADSLLDLTAYIEYEPPYYKVRLGDFLTKQDANALCQNQVRGVYENAWVVETLVRRDP